MQNGQCSLPQAVPLMRPKERLTSSTKLQSTNGRPTLFPPTEQNYLLMPTLVQSALSEEALASRVTVFKILHTVFPTWPFSVTQCQLSLDIKFLYCLEIDNIINKITWILRNTEMKWLREGVNILNLSQVDTYRNLATSFILKGKFSCLYSANWSLKQTIGMDFMD